MIEVKGLGGIVVRVLKHSIAEGTGIQLLTFECTYPRIIHCELLTHGMLNFNSASSRATPFEKMAKNLTGAPVRFGANQTGMQDKGEDYEAQVDCGPVLGFSHPFMLGPKDAWNVGQQQALKLSKAFYEAGYHKQVYNRRTEADQMMKTVISGTEFANFFWLRHHEAADPTLAELARCMYEAATKSKPIELHPGEWHLPYIGRWFRGAPRGVLCYYIEDENGEKEFLTLEEAKIVSAARCAAVSFRNVDYDLEKSKSVYERLLGDERKHGSAFQHQGTPVQDTKYAGSQLFHENAPDYAISWEEGITHADREGQLWSAQFRGWIQLRKLIPGENVPGMFVGDSV